MSTNPRSLFREICEFSKNYPLIHGGLPVGDPRTNDVLANLKSLGLHVATALKERGCTGFETVVSEGHGAFPRYTWICFLPPRQKVSEGVYAGICFDGKGSGALAGCMRSVTSKVITLETLKRSREAKKRINVGDFNDAFLNPQEYFAETFSFDDMAEHLAKSLVMAGTIVADAPTNSAENFGLTPDDKNNFVAALQECGFVAEEGLPVAFLQSLLAKPFVILTGNSGTGKTKIAELLAAWLRGDDRDGHELVAVGADWTDNRNVVGFVNYLRQEKKEDGPVYQSTPVLDLLLQAAQTPSLPFFLILDEMNLSHVERYFADFLSAMEAREGLLRLHSEGDAEEGDSNLPRFDGHTRDVPSKLAYPRNVFVIGTVNVDETTYMFSPKVLDRAHVIEFHADAKHVIDVLNDPRPLAGMSSAPEDTAARFLELSKAARGIDGRALDSLPVTVAAKINGHLGDVLDILRRARFEFAFRTAKELNAYLRVCRHLSADQNRWDATGWRDDLDTEILQKVLPRLHGSRSRAGNLVGALVSYFANGNKDEALQFFPVEGHEEPVKTLTDAVIMAPASPEFPRCFKKMQTMARVLVEEQFVSFIC